jgi:L-asparagine transporter-like permease
MGVGITVTIAVVATLSGLLASLYSVSRLYAMLQNTHRAPSLPQSVRHQPMIVTAGLAILVTVLLDLSRIASMGVFLYLSMDVAVQWGVTSHLLSKLRPESGSRY